MSTIPQGLEEKIDEALARIARLEQGQQEEQPTGGWTYLVARRHPWRRQLCLKGRNMTVGQLVGTIQANGLTVEQAAHDVGLPVPAIREAIEYFEQNRELLALEAAEERRRLAEKGYRLEPPTLPR